jgi:hypothetical protein
MIAKQVRIRALEMALALLAKSDRILPMLRLHALSAALVHILRTDCLVTFALLVQSRQMAPARVRNV